MKPQTSEFLNKVDAFMNGSFKNQWIEINGFRMYVRKSKKYHKGELFDCFDIASIEAQHPGTGLFTEILTQLLVIYPETNFFAESILNPRLPAFLKKYGFVEYGMDNMILIR